MFKIVKASRNTTNLPYNGPTCINAGVKGGCYYLDLITAKKVAKKLTDYNPVGFIVVDCYTNMEIENDL